MLLSCDTKTALNPLQLGVQTLVRVVVLYIERVDALIPAQGGRVPQPLSQDAQHVHVSTALHVQHISALACLDVVLSAKMLKAIFDTLGLCEIFCTSVQQERQVVF